MSGTQGSGNDGPERSPFAKGSELSRKLRDLDKRIDKHRAGQDDPSAKAGPRPPGFGMALRLGGDFVAGVVVGAAIGWGIDRLFGTALWGLIVFLLLGFAAGVLTVMRSAGLIAKKPGLDDPASRRLDE